jgi:hypothetical protein
MAWQHISDEDLERYYLGMVTDESELAPLEEHLLACPPCVKRAEEAQDRVTRFVRGYSKAVSWSGAVRRSSGATVGT